MKNLVLDNNSEDKEMAGNQRPLIHLYQERWFGYVFTLGLAALVGLLLTLFMPRGPATSGQALLVMITSLLVGLAGGFATGSRWAMLLAPVATIITIEFTRIGAIGPTVDLPRLDNTFGVLALVLGRGLHGLFAFLPMILGVELGIKFALRSAEQGQSKSSFKNIKGWLFTAVLGILVLGLVMLIIQPALTPPILGPDGDPIPGSITELTKVNINGSNQALMIRGYDTSKPVLLYLSGGPGQSSLPWPRVLFDDLSRDFMIVGWDQRGTGKSYNALGSGKTLTLEQTIDDTIAVTNYLRRRFGQEKIYLLGESWGTTLGVLAAQKQPDLYYGFIGSGQMVSQRETDQRIYYDLLDYAEETGDEALIVQLQAYQEPPYKDLYAYVFMMGNYDKLYKPYTPPLAYIEKGEQAGLGPWNVLGSEYNFIEKINVFRGFLDTAFILYPQLQEIDFRQDVPSLEIPIYILDGQAELSGRRDLALEWFEQVEAPIKRIYSLENAAHAPAFEHLETFTQIMSEIIMPETYHK